MQTGAVAFLRCAVFSADRSALGYVPKLGVAVLSWLKTSECVRVKLRRAGVAQVLQTWDRRVLVACASAECTTFRDKRHSFRIEKVLGV